MQEQLSIFFFYIRGAISYKWMALVIAWFICVPSWIFVSTLPDKFQSTAKIHLDSRTMLRPLLRGLAIQSNVRGIIGVMQDLMFSQRNLEQIVRLSGLEQEITNEKDKFNFFKGLKKNIRIQGGRNDLFTISYQSTDPDKAKEVVNAVLTVFSEQALKLARIDVDSAQHFIAEQIKDYEIRLFNAEKTREEFRRANYGLLPGQGGNQIGSISGLKTQLEQAKLGLEEALSRKASISEQLEDALEASDEDEWAGLTTSSGSGNLSPEGIRITKLNQQKHELLLHYTEQHPTVLRIDSLVKALQEQQDSSIPGEEEDEGGVDLGALQNPYIQATQVSLNAAEAKVATLRSRVEIYKQRLENLEEKLDSSFSVASAMQNLNRDYDTIKTNYNSLLARRETAHMSEEVDKKATSLKFKISDPPNRPLEPSGPYRKLMYTGVLLVGLLLGLSVAILAHLIKPTITMVKQLRTITGLPSLGAVSISLQPSELSSIYKKNIRFLIGFSFLMVFYCAMLAIELM